MNTNVIAIFLKNIAHENKASILQKELEKYGVIDDPSNRWADASKHVTSGPFRLVTWEINKTIVLEKSSYYWDAKNIKLEKIHYYPIESETAAERTFRAGQINMDHGGRYLHCKTAVTLQQMWKKELGIDIELQNQEWKVFFVSRQ